MSFGENMFTVNETRYVKVHGGVVYVNFIAIRRLKELKKMKDEEEKLRKVVHKKDEDLKW